MGSRAATAALLLLSTPACANSITFEIWPVADPDQVISCVIRLQRGQIAAVEVKGLGMPPRNPARWFPAMAERDLLFAALTGLVDQTIPSVNPTGSRLPPPPFVTATWMAEVKGGLMTGLYIQQGLDLPAPFDHLIAALLPGGMCDRAIGP